MVRRLLFLATCVSCAAVLGAKAKKTLAPWVESAPTKRLLSAEDVPRFIENVKKRIKACEKAICPSEEIRLLKGIISGEDNRNPDLKSFVLRCVKSLDQYRLSLPHDPKLQSAVLHEVKHLQTVLSNRGHVWEANQLASRLLTEVSNLALKAPEERGPLKLHAQLLDLLGATPLSVLRAYAQAHKGDPQDREISDSLRQRAGEYLRSRCRENDIAPSIAVYFAERAAKEGYQRKLVYGSKSYFASNLPALSSYDFYQVVYVPPSAVLLETPQNSNLLPILTQDNSLRSLIITHGEDILVPPRVLGAVGSHALKLEIGKSALNTFQRLCTKVEAPKLPASVAELMPSQYRNVSGAN